jgi:hypothetical protein
MEQRVRPGPIQWLWYAIGGRLPDKHRNWVLHDVTTRTWLWRHAARSSVLMSPLIFGWLLLPASLGLRLALCLMAALVGYFYSFVYAEESGESRLLKNGFPNGTFQRVRAEAKEDVETEIRARYIARYRQG